MNPDKVVFIEALLVGGKEALNLEGNHFPDQVNVIVSAFYNQNVLQLVFIVYFKKLIIFHGLGICLRLRKRYNIILADLNLRKRRYQNLSFYISHAEFDTRNIFDSLNGTL